MWLTLSGVLLGGVISLVGVWLTNHLGIKEHMVERQATAKEQRRVFERNTLQDLNKAITKAMRDVTVIHLADLDAETKTGTYGGHLLPEGIETGHLEHAQELAHLTNLVLDDHLRDEVIALRAGMSHLGIAGPRTRAQGEMEYNQLLAQCVGVQQKIAKVVRELWSPPEAI